MVALPDMPTVQPVEDPGQDSVLRVDDAGSPVRRS